jgi:hypothetical protein
MIRITIALLLVTTFNAAAMDLFKAEYTVYKDGKKIGISSTELTAKEPFYTLTDKTNGTHGMASFLGFKRTESTLFTEYNGQFLPESYQMKQKVAFKKRQSSFEIDRTNNMAYGSHKGKEWQKQVPAVFTTANLVALNLSQDVCQGKTDDLNYTIVKDGKVKQYQFVITEVKGDIVEIDKLHSKPARVTKTWLDKNQNCLPIRTYHIEEGKEALETKLLKLTIQSE